MNIEQTPRGGTADLLQRDGETPSNDRYARESVTSQSMTDEAPLLDSSKSQTFRDQWTAIQAGFVDEPRESVQRADQLVADLIRDLAAQFADERSRLEEQWSRGEEVSTEDLRVALQRYRSFFNRLLTV